MARVGIWTGVTGLAISGLGTLLLFAHVTSEYHAAIQDMDSIAVGYLGLILFGVCVSVTGLTVKLRAAGD